MSIIIQIDAHTIAAAEGDTVLETARKNGIQIPSLCYHPALKPSGSCKLCAVEVMQPGGRTMTMLSCVLKVKSGMEIKSRSEAVHQARTQALTRLVRMAPQAQRLHDLAAREAISLPPAPDGCIRCRLCVRVCKEIIGQAALRMEKQGERLQVVPVGDRCIGCGTCANLCPTQIIRVVDEGRRRIVRINDAVIGVHPLTCCEGCGNYYATEKQVLEVERRTDPHTHLKLRHHYCPACAKLFSERLQIVQRHPYKHRFSKE